MFSALPAPVRGSLSLILYALNTVFWCTPLFIMAAVKAVNPLPRWQRGCRRVLNGIAQNWIWGNNLNQDMTNHTIWDIQGAEALEPRQWYLVLANHQSWVDILVLQRVFHRKIPFLKFFIKKEMFWFPILGQAWWAMDFPFVKRYSKAKLLKHPHLKGKDLETTRRACEKFKHIPLSVMNFVEGTRFTLQKHLQQQSPYAHLLKPKAGGIASVLNAMGDQIHRILDVTIVYPDGVRSFWALVCGNIREIRVRVRSLPVAPELIGDFVNDGDFRARFQEWLNALWAEKDDFIGQLAAPGPARP